MKKSFLLTLVLLAATLTLRADEKSSYSPESRSLFETFTSKILKVYSFQEGEADYTAYVVQWKDHEVVVSPLSMTGEAKKLNVGDSVRCTMNQFISKVGDVTRTRVTFLIAPTGSISADEQHRMEIVAEEVAKRRALREAAGMPPLPVGKALSGSLEPVAIPVAPSQAPAARKP